MLLHTSLSAPELREAFRAADLPGCYLDILEITGSRSHARKINFKLSGDPGEDRDGTRRRYANSGVSGAISARAGYGIHELSGEKAATYDEWGHLFAEVFDRDPSAKCPQYASATDFHTRTS